MSASRWRRILTGVSAGKARLRAAFSALRPSLDIPQLGPSSGAVIERLRPDFSEPLWAPLAPAAFSALRPALRAPLERLRPVSEEVMRVIRSELAALRPGAEEACLAAEETKLSEETSRMFMTALLRRLRPRLKAVGEHVAGYKRFKVLYERLMSKLKKKEEEEERAPAPRRPQPAPAASDLELAAPTEPSESGLVCRGDSWVREADWAILSRVAVVPGHSEQEIIEAGSGDMEVFVVWRVPLEVSTVTARRSDLVSAAAGQDDFPYVVAVDSEAGKFLLRGRGGQHDDVHCYVLCDVATGKATPLPRGLAQRLRDVGSICLITLASAAGHLIVELQAPVGGGLATLERFRLGPDGACCCDYYPHPHHPVTVAGYPPGDRPWGSDGALCHGTVVCFVDLAVGVLLCDPLADNPELVFVPLPEGSASASGSRPSGEADISKRRCVTVSAQLLIYVQMDRAHGGGGHVIQTWSLDMMDGAPQWAPRRLIQVQPSLLASPVLALVHPNKPDILCVCVASDTCSRLLALDLETAAVVDSHRLAMPCVPTHLLGSRFFLGLGI